MARMELKLTYLDPARLWADLLNVEGDRAFVATNSLPVVGTIVTILVEAPELATALSITGIVQGQRMMTQDAPGGVFVHIDAPSLDRCRSAVG